MSHFEARHRYHGQGGLAAAGGSALLDAVNKGKVHLAKFILDAGEQDIVNTRDFKGKTPLIRACYIKEEKTREKLVQLLLSKKADVNLRDECQRTALSYACQLRCNDVVRILVKNNVDPDIADCQGNTALIYSASVGNDVATDILIRSFRRLGLNVDHVNEEGQTALLVAAKAGFIECATILATDGRANVSFHDPQNGMTAEDWARMRGCASPEVLAFSVNANQRLTRCGSTYVARRGVTAVDVTSASAGYATAAATAVTALPFQASLKAEVVVRAEEEDEEQTAEGSRDGAGEREKEATIAEDEMKDDEMLAAAAAAAAVLVGMKPARRKRNSLPTIKLWSSLDLPSQRSTSSPVYEESSPPTLHPHHQSSLAAAAAAGAGGGGAGGGAGGGGDEDGHNAVDVKTEHGRQQQREGGRGTVVSRRHRELLRADTEISRSCDISLEERLRRE